MYENWLILFALVFARVAGLTMTAPIYGTNDVPLQVRVLLAAALALLIAPLQWHGVAVPSAAWSIFWQCSALKPPSARASAWAFSS